MKLMLDTTPLIGIILENDQWHKKSLEIAHLIDENETYITDIILAETLNALKNTNAKTVGEIFENLIRTNKLIIIKTLGKYEKAMEIFLKYNASIGFSDCTTIQTMKEKNINYILSFDSDFDKVDGIVRVYDNTI